MRKGRPKKPGEQAGALVELETLGGAAPLGRHRIISSVNDVPRSREGPTVLFGTNRVIRGKRRSVAPWWEPAIGDGRDRSSGSPEAASDGTDLFSSSFSSRPIARVPP